MALAVAKSTMKARIFISAPQKGQSNGSTSQDAANNQGLTEPSASGELVVLAAWLPRGVIVGSGLAALAAYSPAVKEKGDTIPLVSPFRRSLAAYSPASTACFNSSRSLIPNAS